jgi:hypothetical protein
MQFPATLWTGDPVAGQTVERVWFAGCHGNVGGGTAEAGGVDAGSRLCDITMGWIVANAQDLGLTIDPAAAEQSGTLPVNYALDAIRETWPPRAVRSIYGRLGPTRK